MNLRRRTIVSLLAILLTGAVMATAAPPRPPKLVVILVVDQMRADYAERFGTQWKAGLRRLMTQGAWFRQASYPYMNDETCVGHSTISTGTLPPTHGIPANNWWDRARGVQVYCVDDPQSTLVSYGAPAKGNGSSANLRMPTFTDELRQQMSVAPRIVTMSIKDRTAIMLAGRRADAATWFDAVIRDWVTSSVYTNAPVPFIQSFVKAHPVSEDFGKSWTRVLPETAYLYKDDAAGERPAAGWTGTFPHVLKGQGDKADNAFYDGWQRTPFSDAYLGRMAIASVDALGLGKGAGTDFLAVSFSALDRVGHDFGPRSHEVQDTLARLDQTIGTLLTHLDLKVGRGNYVVALTGDHGVAPVPEQLTAEGFDAGRLLTGDVVDRVDKAVAAALGSGLPASHMIYDDFYFDPGVLEKLAANPAAMNAAIAEIRKMPGVLRVLRPEEIANRPMTDDPVTRAASLSYNPDRSGDLVVIPKPYWVFVNPGGASAGVHATLYKYDARVPVILMGAGIKTGEYLSPASPVDIVPTLAYLCGITLALPDGRLLVEALTNQALPAPRPAAPAAK